MYASHCDFVVPISLLVGAVTIVSRTCIMTADTILIGLTWRKLFSQVSLSKIFGQHLNNTLSYIFLRDGG